MSDRLFIGCDLDNTCVDVSMVCDIVSKELGYNYTMADIQDWDWSTFPEEYKKRGFELFRDSDVMCQAKPFPGVQDKILEWQENGHRVSIITARAKEIWSGTCTQVQALFPTINDLVLVGLGCSKTQYMTGLTHWFDDNGKMVQKSAAMGINTFLISGDHTKYNHYARDTEGVTVIGSLADVEI